MKILQFVYGLNGGGIEAFVTNLNSCRDVFLNSFDYLLFSKEETQDFYEEINRNLGSCIYKVGSNTSKFFLLRCIQKRIRAYRIMKQESYDIVHIHASNVFCMMEAFSAKLAGIPCIIVHSHSTQLGETGIIGFIKFAFQLLGKPVLNRLTDIYCACSTEAGCWMFGKKLTKAGKVHILKNGIIGMKYYYDYSLRIIYRKKIRWDNCYIVGHVGRFSKCKNQSFLIDIFFKLHLYEPRARLLLLGNGELEEQIKRKVSDLHLEEFVCFQGISQEIHCWLQAMDLFLFPSLFEGLPLAGIEAQAADLPILASDTISKELDITDNIHWMSLKESAEKWAEKALELLHTPKVRKSRKEELIKAGYDIETTAKELMKLYTNTRG